MQADIYVAAIVPCHLHPAHNYHNLAATISTNTTIILYSATSSTDSARRGHASATFHARVESRRLSSATFAACCASEANDPLHVQMLLHAKTPGVEAFLDCESWFNLRQPPKISKLFRYFD